jgi:hypothetical protein
MQVVSAASSQHQEMPALLLVLAGCLQWRAPQLRQQQQHFLHLLPGHSAAPAAAAAAEGSGCQLALQLVRSSNWGSERTTVHLLLGHSAAAGAAAEGSGCQLALLLLVSSSG